MAATNINRVVLTGNLTRDPELRSTAERHVGVLAADRVQHAPQEPGHGGVGGQAQLLRRHGLGRAGRELRALPLQGPPRRHRRPPRVARVGGAGRQQAPERRDRRRRRPVPGRPRGRRRQRRRRLHAALRRAGRRPRLPARRRRVAPQRARRTTTSRSRRRSAPAGRPVPPGARAGLAVPATLSGRHRRRRDALPARSSAPGDEISAPREGSNSGEAAQPADAPA